MKELAAFVLGYTVCAYVIARAIATSPKYRALLQDILIEVETREVTTVS